MHWITNNSLIHFQDNPRKLERLHGHIHWNAWANPHSRSWCAGTQHGLQIQDTEGRSMVPFLLPNQLHYGMPGGNACPSCKGPVPDSFLKAARTSLEPVAIPTWEALRQSETPKTSKYLALWHDMILLLGITRQSIRERYRLEKKCCNLDCPTRNSGGRSEKKSTCIRCYSVYYCDRVCQRR